MGRPFAKELAALADTYRWASAAEIGPLTEFARETAGRALIAVGSGGSATAAHLATLLHRFRAAGFARTATPLELLLSEPNLRDAAVLLLSASGKNRDVLAAAERCVQRDARAVAAVCTHRGSPLAAAVRAYERGFALEEDVPCGKDGFLATNSLLATCLFLARAYECEPPEYAKPAGMKVDKVAKRSAAVVLHGGWASPVATDLESKLNESAIASALVSDYRNFGHGRHLWLARRASDTMVIMLVTPETETIAKRTRRLLPKRIPVVELRTEQNKAAGTIDLLLQSFHLVGALGQLQSFDPGRPSVPEFGRKLYHVPPSLPLEDPAPPVARKLACGGHLARCNRDRIIDAFAHFTRAISASRFGGIVLDYDGTLCGRAERFGALRPDIAKECRRLLQGGITIGIATGRGRSVRESLQSTLPRDLWPRVLVGYYNGGEIAPLENTSAPTREARLDGALLAAKNLLDADPLLRELASFTARRRQITIEPNGWIATDTLLSHVMTLLAPIEEQGVRVLMSSHSVDVLPLGVGKLSVVREVERLINQGDVLCIGDRGAWPGNDTALLSHFPSLSVDEVSASLNTCWNLAPPGISGVPATLHYLRAMRVFNSLVTLDVGALGRPG